MSLVTILSRIPWREIGLASPQIVEVAKKIWKKASTTIGLSQPAKERPSQENLQQRIEQLEANELQQAELVKNMALQLGELSTALGIISKRLQLLTILAVFAVIGFAVLALKTWVF
jgi:hypothetical protein